MTPTWPSIMPLGPDHMGARVGLRPRHLGVALQRRVVVDAAVGVQDAAVAVVGELVQAQVGHDDEVVADLGPHVADGDLQDAVRVGARRARRRPSSRPRARRRA